MMEEDWGGIMDYIPRLMRLDRNFHFLEIRAKLRQ
jgi:hypothetical protein